MAINLNIYSININIVFNYRIGVLSGEKLVTSIILISYFVGNWSQLSYRYHIGWEIGHNYRIGIISGGKLVTIIVSVSYWMEHWSEGKFL